MKYSLPLFILLLASCGAQPEAGSEKDTPLDGALAMAFEPGDSPSMQAQIDLFEGIYRTADIQPVFLSQNQILQWLLNDSIRVGFIHRNLSPSEVAMMESQGKKPRVTFLGRSALALITLRGSGDSLISLDRIRERFTGNEDRGYLVFDRTGSAGFLQIRDSVCGGANPGSNVVAAGSYAAVVDYVCNNPGAIGVIGASWLADMTSETSRSVLRRVQALQVQNPDDSQYYKPFFRHVYLKKYPLSFGLYAVNTQHYSGLGTGFITFIGGAQGQLALKKSGFAPATEQERLIQMHLGLPDELKNKP
jgi:phosphate transport system substrate-binding protein